MLDKLLISSEPGKWRAFIDALEDAEFPYLAKLLQGQERIRPERLHSKRILEIFSPYLEQQLNPMDLVPPLYVYRVISYEDKVDITAVYDKIGASAASIYLLDLIQRRLHPDDWYKQFLKILYDVGRSDIATLLEPDFTPDTDLKYPQLQYSEHTDTSDFDPTMEDCIATRIKKYNSELVRYLRVPKIINFLAPTIISSDERTRLIEIDKQDPVKSVSNLLIHIVAQKNVSPFVEALRVADYPYLADLLTKGDVHLSHLSAAHFSRRIDIFRPYICERIDPCIILPHLCRAGVVNYRDKDEIMALNANDGIISSANYLLECIQCRQSPKLWYTEFIKCLVHCGQEDIAKLIEPDFVINSDKWRIKIDECLNEQNAQGALHETEGQCQDTSVKVQNALDELVSHEESILKSERDIRKLLRKVDDDVMKQKCETEKELDRQLSMIMEEINKQRLALIDLMNDCPCTTDNSAENLTKASAPIRILQTSDQNPATLKYSPGYVHPYGFVSTNVLFPTDSIPNVEQNVPPISIDMLDNEPSAHRRPSEASRGNIIIKTDREKRDETDKLSDASSNPSSGYLVYSKDSLEELEQEETEDNSGFSLISNGYFLVSEHTGLCLFSDLDVLPNGDYVLADSLHKCVMLFDDQFQFMQCLQLNDYPVHVRALSCDSVAVHLSSDSNITLWNPKTKHTAALEWRCEYTLCALCTKGTMTVYTLCEGKHMHVFRLDAKLCDEFELGVQNETWCPRFMAVDDKAITKHIYLTERNCNSIFCFYLKGKNLSLRRQYQFGPGISLTGIAYCAGRVLIADSEENILIEMDEKGNYKTSHSDNAILRPFALTYFNGNIFITHANTGQPVASKTIHCYKVIRVDDGERSGLTELS